MSSMVHDLRGQVSKLERQSRTPLFSTEDGFAVDFVEADEIRSGLSFGDLDTIGPTVTVEVSPSGKLLVMLGAHIYAGSNSASTEVGGNMSFELSGANVLSAHSRRALESSLIVVAGDGNLRQIQMHSTACHLVEDLVEGETTIQAKYAAASAANAHIKERIVIGIPL
jgi:hypothetical protein